MKIKHDDTYIGFDTFMNRLVKQLGLDYEFNNDSFDYISIKIEDNITVTEGRAVFGEFIYYLYSIKNVGVVYAYGYNSRQFDEYNLFEHPSIDSEQLSQIVEKCRKYRSKILEHIYKDW